MNKSKNNSNSPILDLRKNKEKNKTKQNPKPKIFYLAFGYGIKAQIVKIKKKFFYTKRMAFLSTFVFLLVGTTIFFSLNYMAKGASYGWLQASWIGGADTGAVATHTDNQSNWTKYYSKDDNVDVTTTPGEMTLSSGSSEVEDTDTADFDAGSDSGSLLVLDTSSDQLTVRAGYDASSVSPSCGDFEVWPVDRSTTANWATAMSYCDSLCPTCDLPTQDELICMCTNKVSFGNNFIVSLYWSATEYTSTIAYSVNFSNCATGNLYKTSATNVRCVRR